jgi:3-methyladenine DNA glycosylase AlkD
MEAWVGDFDNWDLCDQVCGNLFDKTPYAFEKALLWSTRPEEFVKRAGFALMAWLAVHDKRAPDEAFLPFLNAIHREAHDQRNFVKKAVSWALRQVGKRSSALHTPALSLAESLALAESAAARWIGRDAQKELSSPAVLQRIEKRGG